MSLWSPASVVARISHLAVLELTGNDKQHLTATNRCLRELEQVRWIPFMTEESQSILTISCYNSPKMPPKPKAFHVNLALQL